MGVLIGEWNIDKMLPGVKKKQAKGALSFSVVAAATEGVKAEARWLDGGSGSH